MTLADLRWGRVIAGGVLAELGVFAIVLPVQRFFGQQAFLVAILIASFAMPFVFGLWASRRAESHIVLHGVLVGAIAALVYIAVAWGQPEPLLHKIAHGLKLAGGWLGGVQAERRRAYI
jgi:hypothetical protein